MPAHHRQLSTLFTMEQETDELETNDVAAAADDVVDELLIEEISIDGMCGVY